MRSRDIIQDKYNNVGLICFTNVFNKGQQVVNDYTHKIVVKEDGTQSMIVVPAMPHDSGEWTVVAQNRAGKTTVSMTLTVEGNFTPFFPMLAYTTKSLCKLISI